MTARAAPRSAAPGTAPRWLGYAVIAAAACSWGTWGLVIRGADCAGPLDARLDSALVMVVITLVAFALLALERARGPRARQRPGPREWLGVAWLGLADAMNVVLLFAAYRATSLSIAVTTHYLAPLFVALASPFALRERGHPRTYLAVGVGLAGLLLLLRPWNEQLARSDLFGAACGAASALFYASNVLVNKRLYHAFTAIELMAFHGVIAAPLLIALVPHGAWGALHLRSALVLAGGAIGPGALGGVMFVWALRTVPAAHASTLTLLEPLVTVIVAVVLVGEQLAWVSWLGAALILVGAASVLDAPKSARSLGSV